MTLTPDQFAEQFQEHAGALWCVAVAILRDRSLAEDALQDAAVIGLEKIDTFTPGTSYPAWMGQIVRNVARNRLRRRMRDPSRAPDESMPGPGSPASEPASHPVSRAGRLRPDQEAFDDHVVAALEELSETARACLLLRVVHDATYQEIAGLLDIPEGTAMSHVHRARAVLRDRLAGTETADGPDSA